MTKPRIYFTTYADGEYEKHRKRRSLLLKFFLRPKECFIYNRQKIEETPFYESNKDILDEKRGSGYWLWKPYIIREGLRKIDHGDCLIYYDSGIGKKYIIWSTLKTLIEWTEKSRAGIFPGVMIPQWGPNSAWTKRDAFILMDVDHIDKAKQSPQIQATFSIWLKNETSVQFVEEWLKYAQDRRVITDDGNVRGYENYDGFVEHRHDQSILTNLVYKYGIQTINSNNEPVSFSKSLSFVDLYFKENKNYLHKIIYRFILTFFVSRP